MFAIIILFSLFIPNILTHYKAVLVAGSNYWGNYRHQADVFHAYTELTNNGVSPKDITMFAYNDIAYYFFNPKPGVVINQFNGPNVFPGNASISFSGDDVTPENFLNTLLNLSHPNLDLLIYFADHGGAGILCFLDDNLYEDQLKKTILSMKYKSLIFIVEACEAASMFEDWFPNNTNAVVISATDDINPSFACSYDDTLETYLGDCFSMNTLEFLDPADTLVETFEMLTTVVTNQTITSPVQIIGDKSMLKKEIYKYWGIHQGGVVNKISKKFQRKFKTAVSSWDVNNDIGKRTTHNPKFDFIRQQDNKERILYNKLVNSLQKQITVTNNYRPINSPCIRSCVKTLKLQGIILTGYAKKFHRNMAQLCHTVELSVVKNIMLNIANTI